MSDKPEVPVFEGWCVFQEDDIYLTGLQCSRCGDYFFPPTARRCRNPTCGNDVLQLVRLSQAGTIWSYTNVMLAPPQPYVAEDPFRPLVIAAVKLAKENLIVLGQVTTDIDIAQLKIGLSMQLAKAVLCEDRESRRIVWRWKPEADGTTHVVMQ